MHDHCDGGHCHEHEKNSKLKLLILTCGIILYIITLTLSKISSISSITILYMYLVSYILIGYDIIISAIRKLFKKDMFDENLLMSIATIGALIIGEYTESIAVLLFYKIGEYLQDLAVGKSKEKIRSAIDLRPEYSNLYVNGNIKKVEPNKVKIGDILVIKTGEKIPLDCVVIEGKTSLDNSALTGESMPIIVKVGDEITSGGINLGALIKVKVIKSYESSAIYKIIEMTTEAIKNKSNTEKYITKFAKIYTPIVIALALVIFIFFPMLFEISYKDSAFRALSFLVVSCPCALVISVPLGFFVGIGISSKNNILVKGSNYLDSMSNIENVIFDKTGTLTNGKFGITKVNVCNDNSNSKEILKYIAHAESLSNHHLAKSILDNIDVEINEENIKEHKEISGKGIEVRIDEKTVLVGNSKLMDEYKIKYECNEEIGTIIHLAVNNIYYGNIILEDTLKESSINIIHNLKKNGVKNTYLLTGDNKEVACRVKDKLNIDEVYYELLPEDKSRILGEIKSKNKVAYVGDGINDGPVIALADVGISMGNGSDLAVETSDVVILNNDLNKLIDFIKISKRTKRIVNQNILIILAVKVVFLILSGLGISSMWQAVFADVGISLISILNSLRIYMYKSKES